MYDILAITRIQGEGCHTNVPGLQQAYYPKDSTNQCFLCEQ